MRFNRDKISPVFLKNDIRGVYGEILNDEFAYWFGVAMARYLGNKGKVILGCDNRSSSPKLVETLTKGLTDSGVSVQFLGIVPTSCVYYLSATNDVDAGVIVTASHNPKEYNGIKVCDSEGASYSYDTLYSTLLDWMSEGIEVEAYDQGTREESPDLVLNYTNFLKNVLEDSPALNVVVEYGNGTTSLFSKVLAREKVTEFGKEFDPEFSRLIPDPAKPATYKFLREELNRGEYDLGIAFDTDGDRVGFCDERGEIISPDTVAMLFMDYLGKSLTPKLLIDVKMSEAVVEYGEEKGYTVEFTQVGHSKVHENLEKKQFHLAAELSCHYYFNHGYHGFDDGLYAATIFLNLVKEMKRSGETLSSVLRRYPVYYPTKEFRVKCPRDSQEKIIDELKTLAAERDAETITIDGLRCRLDQGWFLVRQSSTEELISYRAEGRTPEDRDYLLSIVQEVVDRFV